MKKLGLVILLTVFTSVLFAQWECRSQLSSNLKPFAKSNLYWASEVTIGAGYLTNNAIFNTMGFLGLDYSFGKSVIFSEIGYKYWYRADLNTKINFDNGHFGIRELFYQYKGDKSRFIVGIQSATYDDYFLLNERMLGISYKYNRDGWSFNFNGGTVLKGFSRNGLFCSVGFLYDIIQGRDLALIGSKPGETNFAGFSVKYSSSNEFDSEFSSSDSKSKFRIRDVGLILYSEFGSLINNVVYIPGLFLKIDLPANISFKPEILYQISEQNDKLIYSIALESNNIFSKSKLSFSAKYIGAYNIDESAKVLNSYSNLFMGDVLRLDSRDALPLFHFGTRLSFPSIKTHFKMQYSTAKGDISLSELDFEVGKRFTKHLQFIALTGFVNNRQIIKDYFFGRIECRISL